MKIFVNDKPLELISFAKLDPTKRFEHRYQNVDEIPEDVEWEGNVIFYEPSLDLVIRLLYLMRTRKMKRLDSVTLVSESKNELKEFVKSRFLIVKAAGGVITKKQKVLLIHRLGKWDFPKGKFDKGETPEQCAKREVEEECNVKVRLGEHLCTTWHTYIQQGDPILKATEWYVMRYHGKNAGKPQKEEGITDLKWLTESEWDMVRKNTYPSVLDVLAEYTASR